MFWRQKSTYVREFVVQLFTAKPQKSCEFQDYGWMRRWFRRCKSFQRWSFIFSLKSLPLTLVWNSFFLISTKKKLLFFTFTVNMCLCCAERTFMLNSSKILNVETFHPVFFSLDISTSLWRRELGRTWKIHKICKIEFISSCSVLFFLRRKNSTWNI